MNIYHKFGFLLCITAICMVTGACRNSGAPAAGTRDSAAVVNKATRADTAVTGAAAEADCSASDTLIYQADGLSSSTEYKMRGAGVVSFELGINDRLDIYNMDGSNFGFLVLNEDSTFYTLDMPRNIVARSMIPEFDAAQFDFDAEPVDADKEFLLIYVNKQKRKVKKSAVKHTFYNWEKYVRMQHLSLKACNLPPAANGNNDLIYEIMAIKGDKVHIRSVQNCSGEDGDYKLVEAWTTWKKNDSLTVDLTTCH